MAKHKPLCLIVTLLVIVGGLNWGLVGLGRLLGNVNLNLVNIIFGFLPIVESIVYLAVGVCAVALLVFTMQAKDCTCEKMEK